MNNRSLHGLKFLVASLVFILAIMLLSAAGPSFANPYGTNITVYDGVGGTSSSTAPQEDNEVEPGMAQSQAWDLEGFFLNRTSTGTMLTIVGGYNFYTGYQNMKAGDIFIDTNGDSIHSPGIISGYDYNPGYNDVSNGLFKYDYVLDIDWTAGSFAVVKLDSTSMLENTMYGNLYNKPSNPWRYLTGGEIKASGNFITYGKASQTNTGFNNWLSGTLSSNHYVATFDLTGVILGSENWFHNTMECGNDNLIGYTHTPEPATMVLFGAGIAGLAAIRRRKKA